MEKAAAESLKEQVKLGLREKKGRRDGRRDGRETEGGQGEGGCAPQPDVGCVSLEQRTGRWQPCSGAAPKDKDR